MGKFINGLDLDDHQVVHQHIDPKAHVDRLVSIHQRQRDLTRDDRVSRPQLALKALLVN